MTTNLHDKMLAAIDAYFSASDRDEEMEAEDLLLDVRDEINKHKLAEQPAQQKPYGWKVYGVNSLFMGEFAESDAKAEAKRIGGTCITFPLYTTPQAQPSQPLTDEETSKLFDSLVDEMLEHSYQGSHDSAEKAANEIRRMYKAAHGITKGNT